MRYLGCYDITDDARRFRISNALLDYGARIEQSVFECILEPAQAQEMLRRLERIIVPQLDKVHVFELCAACARRCSCLGLAERPQEAPFYIV